MSRRLADEVEGVHCPSLGHSWHTVAHAASLGLPCSHEGVDAHPPCSCHWHHQVGVRVRPGSAAVLIQCTVSWCLCHMICTGHAERLTATLRSAGTWYPRQVRGLDVCLQSFAAHELGAVSHPPSCHRALLCPFPPSHSTLRVTRLLTATSLTTRAGWRRRMQRPWPRSRGRHAGALQAVSGQGLGPGRTEGGSIPGCGWVEKAGRAWACWVGLGGNLYLHPHPSV